MGSVGLKHPKWTSPSPPHSVQFPNKVHRHFHSRFPSDSNSHSPGSRHQARSLSPVDLSTSPPLHLPTDLLRTQALGHGAQLWCGRFDVRHANLQEPHIFFFRVTWKVKWKDVTARPAQALGDENQSDSPNHIWKQLPQSQVGQLQIHSQAPVTGATVPAETCLFQPGMGPPFMSPSVGTKNNFPLDAEGEVRTQSPTGIKPSVSHFPFSKKIQRCPEEAGSAGCGTPVHCSWA